MTKMWATFHWKFMYENDMVHETILILVRKRHRSRNHIFPCTKTPSAPNAYVSLCEKVLFGSSQLIGPDRIVAWTPCQRGSNWGRGRKVVDVSEFFACDPRIRRPRREAAPRRPRAFFYEHVMNFFYFLLRISAMFQ